MPKALEKCVADLEGKTNPRTKKVFTRSERFAICNNAIKKDKDHKASIDEFTDFANKYIDRLVRSGRARTTADASALLDANLAKAGFDIEVLKKTIE